MTTSTPAVGTEIDSWCTSCRLDLGHRIVAMVGSAPKRVVCLTCGKTHNYRRPQSAEPEKAKEKKPRATSARTRAPARGAEARRLETENRWQEQMDATAGALVDYGIDKSFSEGDRLAHSKFGPGVVQSIMGPQKMSVLFRDGEKTLAHSRT